MTRNMKWVGYGLREIALKSRRECMDSSRIDFKESTVATKRPSRLRARSLRSDQAVHDLEESERQILRRSSAKITDNAACSYSEISVLSWDFGETFAIRYESFRQRTKVGLIDLVARKTQQLSDLNYESHIGKRFLVDTEGVR
ncbi:hypothetical protein F2Q70_00042449 [Brassica cretica]|uniref:Uncharacterized protein n=1 Tax=Brassica cretica TaxID=69181 RepID=A0A8S9KEG1_BRACR|nr:hypothetical protein F2Q70_00042449 [Brassica cretica]